MHSQPAPPSDPPPPPHPILPPGFVGPAGVTAEWLANPWSPCPLVPWSIPHSLLIQLTKQHPKPLQLPPHLLSSLAKPAPPLEQDDDGRDAVAEQFRGGQGDTWQGDFGGGATPPRELDGNSAFAAGETLAEESSVHSAHIPLSSGNAPPLSTLTPTECTPATCVNDRIEPPGEGAQAPRGANAAASLSDSADGEGSERGAGFA
ncbi:hypothetical protein JCM10296v2_000363 [Rhodotorula toruloides]